MKKVIVLILILTLVLSACGDGENRDNTAAETAALSFAEAILANDEPYLSANTCVNVPPGSTSLDTYSFFTIGMAIRESLDHSLADLEIDLSATTESEDAEEAMIRMVGSVSFPESLPASQYAPLPIDHTSRIDEVWRMRLEEGRWKWCGGTENLN